MPAADQTVIVAQVDFDQGIEYGIEEVVSRISSIHAV